MSDIPYGYCHCGCGELAPISNHTHTDRGYRKGEPCRYILGHQLRRGGQQYIVDPETGCWEWQWGGRGQGYAGIRDNGRFRAAHIVFWERVHGPVPAGLELDHLCRNRLCVNPDHLEAVTSMVNCQRGSTARLTPEAVLAIRERFARGGITQAALATEHGVTAAAISLVVLGRTWRNITKESH